MHIKDKYLMLFYSACGKATPYIQRDEQVTNAYWLVSIMQGVNLSSLLFLSNYLFPLEGLTQGLFFGIFLIPFILNYFIFLKRGKKRIIENVDALVKDGVIKSKALIIKYIMFTIVFLAVSAMINNEDFQSLIKSI